MGEGPRSDRLGREELEALQQKALREWRDSDWLARYKPRAWTTLPDDGLVRVDLGGGVGESEQEPGFIVLDSRRVSRTELRQRSGESRIPDLVWELSDGLPFEDGTVDHFHAAGLLRDLPQTLYGEHLPRELARTLKAGGVLELEDDVAVLEPFQARLADHGFAVEDESAGSTDVSPTHRRSRLRKTHGHTTNAPGLVREHVYGDLQIREPRQPRPA